MIIILYKVIASLIVLFSLMGIISENYGQTINIDIRGVNFEMIYVEGGTFQMGRTFDDGEGCNPDSVYTVELSDYYISKTEVTQELWETLMDKNPSKNEGAQLPVEGVSWHDCCVFVNKLSRIKWQEFRLPTEAEWEYAARGGNKSKGYKYSGGNNIDSVAWYNANSMDKTHPVATKRANELGIHDMSGNVMEWCNDIHGDYIHKNKRNPKGAANGVNRVFRGSSYWGNDDQCSVTYRDNAHPELKCLLFGFRLVLIKQ